MHLSSIALAALSMRMTLWQKAMEELRLEAERGEEKSEEELAWILSYTIALQHMHEHNE